MNIPAIAKRVVKASVAQQLAELLPSEAYKVLSRYDFNTQSKFLDALVRHKRHWESLRESRRGDPSRSGQEDGYILSVNAPITINNDFNPEGSFESKIAHRWDFEGNHIELATYRRTWSPLD